MPSHLLSPGKSQRDEERNEQKPRVDSPLISLTTENGLSPSKGNSPA